MPSSMWWQAPFFRKRVQRYCFFPNWQNFSWIIFRKMLIFLVSMMKIKVSRPSFDVSRRILWKAGGLCSWGILALSCLYAHGLTPMWFRYSSQPNSMILRSPTDFAPTLHRLWYGGRAEEERRRSEGEAKEKRTCNGGITKVGKRPKKDKNKVWKRQSEIKGLSFFVFTAFSLL